MENIIIGGILGFFAAVFKDFVTMCFQNKRENKKFQREKMEEIFLLIDKTQHTIYTTQAIILNNNIFSKGEYDSSISRLSMLIKYYAKDIEEQYKEYVKIYDEVRNYLEVSIKNKKMEMKDLVINIQEQDKEYINNMQKI